MADIPQLPNETDLERRLATLGRQMVFPPTPPLALRVRQHLAAPRPEQRSRPWARRFVVALAAVVLAFAVVVAVAPVARSALAGRLGLPGIDIHQIPFAPPVPVTATKRAPTATPLPLGERLHLGTELSLPTAQQRVSFPILLPAQLGSPNATYVATPPPGGEVTLVYQSRAGLPATTETGVGLLLSEVQGHTDQAFISKAAGPGTAITPVAVAGRPGFWLTGQPHEFLYQDAGGAAHQQPLRLAGQTLIWTRGNLTLRIESALAEDDALRIANSVH